MTDSDFTFVQRHIARLLIVALVWQPLAIQAQVTAAGATRIDAAQNGVPVVQIAAPNGAGVSHNQYPQFNVDARGLILNNSPVIVTTQQAGYITGNPNLGGGSARLIVNEVTGSQASSLQGYTEVAGPRADVVIANPNGITCDGCGFINTSRGVLTTGVPVFGGNGSLDAFRVSGGQITIGGAGLDGSRLDQLDLVSRNLVVGGIVSANTLNVVTGPNQVDYATLAATPIAGSGAAPANAIDVALLGGMYAGKIRLLATEAGVGVNSLGNLVAQSGDFRLDAAGRITLGGQTQAAGAIAIAAGQDLVHTGTLYAGGDASLWAGGQIANRGTLAAQGNLFLSGAGIDSTGLLAAGVDGTGTLSQPGALVATTSGALRARGRNFAGGDLVLAGATLDLAGATTAAGGNATLIATGGALDHTGGVLQSDGRLTLEVAGAVINDGGQMIAGGPLAAQAAAFSNQGGVLAQKGSGAGTVSVSGAFDNRAGAIASNGPLTLTLGSLDNRGGSVRTYGTADLGVNATGAIDNANGTLAAVGNLSVRSASLDNSTGLIAAGLDLGIIAPGIANPGGILMAGRDVSLTTDSLAGDGVVAAGRDLALALSGSYTQTAGNVIQANRNLDLTLGGDLTNQGTLAAVGQLTVHAANVNNQAGATLQADRIDLAAGQGIDNAGAVVASTLNATAPTLSNTGSLFGQDIALTAGTLTNQGSGVIAAGNRLSLWVANALANLDGGLLYSAGDLFIAGDATRDANGWLSTPTAHVLNRSASIQAGGNVEITTTTLDNQRTSVVTGTRTVSSNVQLIQDKDGNWSSSLIGAVYANGTGVQTDTTTVTCDLSGKNCTTDTTSNITPNWYFGIGNFTVGTATTGPVRDCSSGTCQLVTTTTNTFVLNPHGSAYWGIPGMEAIPTYSIQDVNNQNRTYGEIRRIVMSEQTQDYVVSATPEAQILAGGNLYLRAGTVNNIASRIEAAGNFYGDIGTLNNTGTTLYDKTRSTLWHGGCNDIKHDNPGNLDPDCKSTWYWTADVSDTVTGTHASLDSVIAGGSSLTLSAVTVRNSTVGAQGLPAGGINLTVAGTRYTPPAYVFSVPANGLYREHKEPGAHYLVETDPRFTQFGRFISSDYLLGLLGLNPDQTQKRLGDGFYEQQLVREQIAALRGQSYLGHYASLNDEYEALLEAGAAFARQFDIEPGVTLTQAQVAAVAHDMVWLETRVVDGQSVLVPVVYLAPAPDTPNSRATGAVIAGTDGTTIGATDIANSGTIGAATSDTRLAAGHDLVNDSGTIRGQNVLLTAGNDLHLGVATAPVTLAPGITFTQAGTAGTVQGSNVVLAAGRDLTLAGGAVQADNALLTAGRDLTVGSQTLSTEQHLKNGGAQYDRSATTERGSQLSTTGDLTLAANRNLTVAGSQVQSGGNLTAVAGNQLSILAAHDTDSVASSGHSKEVDAQYQSYSDTAHTSTLSAGGNLTLQAGTLVTEGAKIQAGGDIGLGADTVVLAAAHDQSAEQSASTKKGQGSTQQGQTLIERDRATGTIVAAGGNLTITSTGATVVEGGALAAGKTLSIATGGDLTLAAAQGSYTARIQSSEVGHREATTLDYSDDRVSQLLTTITAGQGASLQVGGNFSAAVGERRPDGTWVADRMTVDGVVKGDSRQQVSVKRTGDGADAHPSDSQVLGNLQAQGIRNGSNESFAPGAALNGQAALQQYVASGLLQVKDHPQVAAVLQNTNGATLTYKDDSGAIHLTVAGQAKVQEVYNTLKLTETFDKKKFADQQTAQIATLVAAVVLTICTAGAGAALLGAQGVAATMIDAAIVGMGSTMIGQLAGGASFGQAFEAGAKAGATSAITAGILNAPVLETAQGGMQSINQFAGLDKLGSNLVNNFDSANILQGIEGIGLRGVVNAGVGQLVYGKQAGGFGQAFAGSVISDLGAVGAGAIGAEWGSGPNANPVMQTIAHAGLGAAVAAAKGKDAVAGAIGGASESILGNVLDATGNMPDLTNETNRNLYAGGAELLGGIVSAAAGHDFVTAAQAAQNAAYYNRLLHPDQIRGINVLAGSNTQKAHDLTAALCFYQNCNVDGLSGYTGDATAQQLYNDGKAMASGDKAYYDSLIGQIQGAGLLSGKFSYASYGIDSISDQAGKAGSSVANSYKLARQVITPQALNEALVQPIKNDDQAAVKALQGNPVLGPAYGTVRAVVTAAPEVLATAADAGRYLSPSGWLMSGITGNQGCLSDLCQSFQTNGFTQTASTVGTNIMSLPSRIYGDFTSGNYLTGTENLMNGAMLLDGSVGALRAGASLMGGSAAARAGGISDASALRIQAEGEIGAPAAPLSEAANTTGAASGTGNVSGSAARTLPAVSSSSGSAAGTAANDPVFNPPNTTPGAGNIGDVGTGAKAANDSQYTAAPVVVNGIPAGEASPTTPAVALNPVPAAEIPVTGNTTRASAGDAGSAGQTTSGNAVGTAQVTSPSASNGGQAGTGSADGTASSANSSATTSSSSTNAGNGANGGNSADAVDAAATSPLGRVISSHSAVAPGPLDSGIAGTFAGGRYTVVELAQDTTLYRAGTADRPLGQFFDITKPDGVLQTRIDKAVLPVWPGGATSPIDTSFAVSIPKGTTVYVGEVGSQGGFYVGGTQQIVVLKPWAIDGVKVLNSSPLK